MKRSGLAFLGFLFILGGVVWFFQGIGVLPGSFMTGESFWAIAGAAAAIFGFLIIRAARRMP